MILMRNEIREERRGCSRGSCGAKVLLFLVDGYDETFKEPQESEEQYTHMKHRDLYLAIIYTQRHDPAPLKEPSPQRNLH